MMPYYQTSVLIAALLLSTAVTAAEYPPGLFEHSPEVDSCDFQHQCYHMDPAHPDKVTPPPPPQYPERATPPVEAAMPTPRELPDSDPQSCFNLRRGIFATPQAAANARAKCQ
jgi:hypothetical protein